VRETVNAIRQAYKGRLLAVFEPRTNTSRRNIFQAEYALAFDAADEIVIRTPSDPHKVPEKERFSVSKLVQDLTARGKSAFLFEDTDGVLNHLLSGAAHHDVVLIMSNGAFDGLHDRLINGLDEKESRDANTTP
jgi:UDP-N-acetylmuramate: L-alanyl-gamma-D-glutamyl-meso-diaminopimelate ligase